MDKENVVYTYNGIQFGLKKERNFAIWDEWMNAEDIMLGEISQLQNDRYRMIHLYEVSKIVKVEWWLEEVGNGELLINGHQVLVNQDE